MAIEHSIMLYICPSDLLGTEMIKKLLSSTCVLLSSKTREVVRATLEFMKVTIGVLPPSELVPHVEDMVRQQFSWRLNLGLSVLVGDSDPVILLKGWLWCLFGMEIHKFGGEAPFSRPL